MPDSDIEYSDSARLVPSPLVSVIMATYNHERYLAEAIEGVLRQEVDFPIELIIGEDCSTDGTKAVALTYQRRFPEVIRVITSQQNVGMHKNGARIIAAARGEFVAFCEGDDFWHRADKLQKQVAMLQRDPEVVLVCSSFRRMSDDGEILDEDVIRSEGFRGEWISYEDMVLKMCPYVLTLTAIARTHLIWRALIESPQCKDHSLPMGDLQMWLELVQSGKIRFLPDVLASYRMSPNSASRHFDPTAERRFWGAVREVKFQYLERLPLPQKPQETLREKIRLTEYQLREAAVLADRVSGKRQVARMKTLKKQLSIRDVFWYIASQVPLGRPLTVPVAKAIRQAFR